MPPPSLCSPVSLSGPPRMALCWDLVSVPALPPAGRGEGSPRGASPHRGLSLCLTWYCGVEAEGSSPAKSDSESSSCRRAVRGGQPQCVVPPPISAQYQQPAPAPGGAHEGVVPLPHVDQAALGDGAAGLQHQLLRPEHPRLALGGTRRGLRAQLTPLPRGSCLHVGGHPWAQPPTHPEVGAGLQRLRVGNISIWRSWGGFGLKVGRGLRWGWV